MNRQWTLKIDIVPDKLAFCLSRGSSIPPETSPFIYVPDRHLYYDSFFLDFGPYSLSNIHTYICAIDELAQHAEAARRTVYHLCPSSNPRSVANSVVLIGAYMLSRLGMSLDETLSRLQPAFRFCAKFHDASPFPDPFGLTVEDVLTGFATACKFGFYNPDSFDQATVLHYDNIYNGDMNWVVPLRAAPTLPTQGGGGNGYMNPNAPHHALHTPTPGSLWSPVPPRYARIGLLALSTPNGSLTHIPARAYAELFSGGTGPQNQSNQSIRNRNPPSLREGLGHGRIRIAALGRAALGPWCPIDTPGVGAIDVVVRLNAHTYDRKAFTRRGIGHVSLVFPDGTTPPLDVLRAFMSLADRYSVAVHCKAGLGRTGTLICAWLIRRLGFTPRAAIGWCRLCRPGSVIGPQQDFLERIGPTLRRADWDVPRIAVQLIRAAVLRDSPLLSESLVRQIDQRQRAAVSWVPDLYPEDVVQTVPSESMPASFKKDTHLLIMDRVSRDLDTLSALRRNFPDSLNSAPLPTSTHFPDAPDDQPTPPSPEPPSPARHELQRVAGSNPRASLLASCYLGAYGRVLPQQTSDNPYDIPSHTPSQISPRARVSDSYDRLGINLTTSSSHSPSPSHRLWTRTYQPSLPLPFRHHEPGYPYLPSRHIPNAKSTRSFSQNTTIHRPSDPAPHPAPNPSSGVQQPTKLRSVSALRASRIPPIHLYDPIPNRPTETRKPSSRISRYATFRI